MRTSHDELAVSMNNWTKSAIELVKVLQSMNQSIRNIRNKNGLENKKKGAIVWFQ